jgi:hypothetical protein
MCRPVVLLDVQTRRLQQQHQQSSKAVKQRQQQPQPAKAVAGAARAGARGDADAGHVGVVWMRPLLTSPAAAQMSLQVCRTGHKEMQCTGLTAALSALASFYVQARAGVVCSLHGQRWLYSLDGTRVWSLHFTL